jgi:hypothetical protein
MKDNRYIEILKWAYEKRVGGFSEKELFQKFDPDGTEEFKRWYLYVFRGSRNNEDCLIGLYLYKDNTHYLCLTAKGLSEAISHLSLEEARKNSKYALWFAGLSLLISAWQFLLPVNIGPVCYGSTTVGDKLTHRDCMFVLRVG